MGRLDPSGARDWRLYYIFVTHTGPTACAGLQLVHVPEEMAGKDLADSKCKGHGEIREGSREMERICRTATGHFHTKETQCYQYIRNKCKNINNITDFKLAF